MDKLKTNFKQGEAFLAEDLNKITKFANDIDDNIAALNSDVENALEQIGEIEATVASLKKDSTEIIDTTWAELKSLRDSGELIAGKHYCITDYVTDVPDNFTHYLSSYNSMCSITSVKAPFKLIVMALSNNTLSETGVRAFLDSKEETFNIQYVVSEVAEGPKNGELKPKPTFDSTYHELYVRGEAYDDAWFSNTYLFQRDPENDEPERYAWKIVDNSNGCDINSESVDWENNTVVLNQVGLPINFEFQQDEIYTDSETLIVGDFVKTTRGITARVEQVKNDETCNAIQIEENGPYAWVYCGELEDGSTSLRVREVVNHEELYDSYSSVDFLWKSSFEIGDDIYEETQVTGSGTTLTLPSYFSNACLESLDIRYCIDNDTNRFDWAKPYTETKIPTEESETESFVIQRHSYSTHNYGSHSTVTYHYYAYMLFIKNIGYDGENSRWLHSDWRTPMPNNEPLDDPMSLFTNIEQQCSFEFTAEEIANNYCGAQSIDSAFVDESTRVNNFEWTNPNSTGIIGKEDNTLISSGVTKSIVYADYNNAEIQQSEGRGVIYYMSNGIITKPYDFYNIEINGDRERIEVNQMSFGESYLES